MKDPHAVALGQKGGKAGTGKAKARSSEQARANGTRPCAPGKRRGRPRKLANNEAINVGGGEAPRSSDLSDDWEITNHTPSEQALRWSARVAHLNAETI